jgi:hypothetical protein
VKAVILACAVAAAATWSGHAFAAGAAYVVDTADVSEPGACKVESWMSAAGNHDFFLPPPRRPASSTCFVRLN